MLCPTGIGAAQNYGRHAGNFAELANKLFKQRSFLLRNVRYFGNHLESLCFHCYRRRDEAQLRIIRRTLSYNTPIQVLSGVRITACIRHRSKNATLAI
jgi:hypothetical protein